MGTNRRRRAVHSVQEVARLRPNRTVSMVFLHTTPHLCLCVIHSFLVSTHFTNYNPWLFAINFSALLIVLVPKLPMVSPTHTRSLSILSLTHSSRSFIVNVYGSCPTMMRLVSLPLSLQCATASKVDHPRQSDGVSSCEASATAS